MYKYVLCQRYLRTRLIALASIVSVTLGVATMIVVNSVMAGFGSEMRDRIKGILSDIVIETNSMNGEADPEQQLALVRDVAGRYIAGMTTTVEVYGMLSFQYAGQWVTRPITLIGIDPKSKADVGPLVDYLQSYRAEREGNRTLHPAERMIDETPGWELTPRALAHRMETAERRHKIQEMMQNERRMQQLEETPDDHQPADFHDPFAEEANDPAVPATVGQLLPGRVYLGAGLISFPYEDKETGQLRTMMMVRPGDDVKVSTVTAGEPPSPAYFNATVVDIFKSGMSEYDSSLAFCNLEYLQQVRGMIDPATKARAVTSVQIKLHDYHDAPQVVELLRRAFPPGRFTIRTWEQKQGPLLAAVDVESAILNVLLFLIITVAGFGILAIFFMIVVEKTRDIGILKALGASSRGIMTVFLSYGLSLGFVGSSVGVFAGLLFVKYINEIEALIAAITGRKVFDERIYYFPKIPTHVNVSMVIGVAFGAVLIAVLASILPARRAACLRPVQALRYE